MVTSRPFVICMLLAAVHAYPASPFAPSNQCKKSSYDFCCEFGTPCDCTKGTTAPGQCAEASYAFCCSVGSPCDCTQPPVASPSITVTLNPEWLRANVSASHYEDPKPNGCQSDELAIQIQGITGDFCSPKCAGTTCPTDVPSGATATPQCALQDQSGNKYCALICSPSANDSCGTATCKSIQGTGICTYDDR